MPKDVQSNRHVYIQISALLGLAFLEAFSWGIISPMMTIVCTEFFARQYTAHGIAIDCNRYSHDPACVMGSKDADWWSSLVSGSGSISFFLISSTIGQAADYYGRKPFILGASLLRIGYPISLMYLVRRDGWIWPFFVTLYVCTSFPSTGVMSAAVADIVSTENRATAFGLIFAAFSVGFSVAAGIASIFTRMQSICVMGLITILRIVWVTFVFPETLLRSHRSTNVGIINPIRGMSILLRSSLFVRLTILITLTCFVSNGIQQIRPFYLNTVVGFNEKDLGHLLLAFGIGSIVAQTLLLKPLMACGKERGVIIVALTGSILEWSGYILSAFIPNKYIIFATIVPVSVSDLSFAAISSLKSINCADHEQGRLQVAIFGYRGIFEATGPLVYAALYSRMDATSKWSLILPYLLSMGLYVCSILLALSLPHQSASKNSIKSNNSGGILPITLSPPGPQYDDNDDFSAIDAPTIEANLSEPLLGHNGHSSNVSVVHE